MFQREGSGIPGARQARKSVPRARTRAEIPFPFTYERLSPMLCNDIQFRHASVRAIYMSLFPAIFLKFKMPEGLKFFFRYPVQLSYLLA